MTPPRSWLGFQIAQPQWLVDEARWLRAQSPLVASVLREDAVFLELTPIADRHLIRGDWIGRWCGLAIPRAGRILLRAEALGLGADEPNGGQFTFMRAVLVHEVAHLVQAREDQANRRRSRAHGRAFAEACSRLATELPALSLVPPVGPLEVAPGHPLHPRHWPLTRAAQRRVDPFAGWRSPLTKWPRERRPVPMRHVTPAASRGPRRMPIARRSRPSARQSIVAIAWPVLALGMALAEPHTGTDNGSEAAPVPGPMELHGGVVGSPGTGGTVFELQEAHHVRKIL